MLSTNLFLENDTDEDKFETKILFRETCYDDDMRKFKLLCLDAFLEPSIDDSDQKRNDGKSLPSNINHELGDGKQDTTRRLSTVRGCMQFISHNLGGQNLLRKIEQFAHDFEHRQSFSTNLSKKAR